MGLTPQDIRMLSPDAQRQIAAALGERARLEAEKKRKFRNTPTDRMMADGDRKITFDSAKEARRYDELMLRIKAGQISDLKLQPQFTLQEAYTTPSGERIRAIRYQADFSYWEDGELVVEDVKSKATKTREYSMKRKLMAEKYGIEIREVM